MSPKILSVILLAAIIGGSLRPSNPVKNINETLAKDTEYYFDDLKEFDTIDTSGNKVTQDVFKDKDISIVHFWSTDCIDCLNELPQIGEIQSLVPSNVQLITVVIKDGDFWVREAQQCLDKYNITAQTLMLGDGDLKATKDKLTWIPTTLIVDSSGELLCEGLVGGAPERWIETVKGLGQG